MHAGVHRAQRMRHRHGLMKLISFQGVGAKRGAESRAAPPGVGQSQKTQFPCTSHKLFSFLRGRPSVSFDPCWRIRSSIKHMPWVKAGCTARRCHGCESSTSGQQLHICQSQWGKSAVVYRHGIGPSLDGVDDPVVPRDECQRRRISPPWHPLNQRSTEPP